MNHIIKKLLATMLLSIVASTPSFAAKPVNVNASPEAVALLAYLNKVSGKQILTGQHNAPLNGSNRLVGIHKQVGEYPAVFGQDFGFSEPGSWDGINFRQNIIDEAIRRHQEGFVNTIMWHAVNPMHDEPQGFKASIQSKLTDVQWQELLTDGSALNARWKSQVDVIAWHLKQLQYANVPVLWRPYHEMNGFWFWWGARQGTEGYEKLWIMLYERLVDFHKLNNLIWVWNANEVKDNVPDYRLFYPGHKYVDILATDVYSGRYTKKDYDQLVTLADGRPIALGEIGKLPTPEILKKQNRWVWFMSWRDPDNFFWGDGDSLKALFKFENAVGLHELPWSVTPKTPKLHTPFIR